MRHLRTFSLAALLLVCCLPLWASTIVYTFKVADDSGVPLAGATLTQNTVKSLASSTLGNAVNGLTLTPVDLGNGDYGVAYDPESTNGEIIVNFTASKAGSTLSGQNASISVNLTKDSSRVLNADVAVSTRNAVAPANPTDYARNNAAPSWYAAGGDPFSIAKGAYGAGTWGSFFAAIPQPSDFVTYLFAQPRFQRIEANEVGNYTRNPATGVITLTRQDGATYTMTIAVDGQGRTTARTVSP